MKIVDQYSDDSFKKELALLTTKMATLSDYQQTLVNPITPNKDYQELFNKKQEDYHLFEAGLLYIFSKPIYKDNLIYCLNTLSFQQRANFYAYYTSFSETAANQGFLSDYTAILKNLEKQTLINYSKIIVFAALLLSIFLITKSLFITLAGLVILSYLNIIYAKIDNISPYTKQTDLIIQKLNADAIDSNLDWAKEKLIDAGWLTKNGKIISSNF